MLWAVELARFQLAAGGGRRTEPNVVLWLLFAFALGLNGVRGETRRHLNVSDTACHVMGHYVSQQCQMGTGCFVKPGVCISLRCSGWIWVRQLGNSLKNLSFFFVWNLSNHWRVDWIVRIHGQDKRTHNHAFCSILIFFCNNLALTRSWRQEMPSEATVMIYQSTRHQDSEDLQAWRTL